MSPRTRWRYWSEMPRAAAGLFALVKGDAAWSAGLPSSIELRRDPDDPTAVLWTAPEAPDDTLYRFVPQGHEFAAGPNLGEGSSGDPFTIYPGAATGLTVYAYRGSTWDTATDQARGGPVAVPAPPLFGTPTPNESQGYGWDVPILLDPWPLTGTGTEATVKITVSGFESDPWTHDPTSPGIIPGAPHTVILDTTLAPGPYTALVEWGPTIGGAPHQAATAGSQSGSFTIPS